MNGLHALEGLAKNVVVILGPRLKVRTLRTLIDLHNNAALALLKLGACVVVVVVVGIGIRCCCCWWSYCVVIVVIVVVVVVVVLSSLPTNQSGGTK